MMDSTNFDIISANNFANVMGVSKATLEKWEANNTFVPEKDATGKRYFFVKNLMHVPEIAEMAHSRWKEEMQPLPLRDFYSIELFAGAGGLALGMEKAGFKHVMLNEFDAHACKTLRLNRPEWNVMEGDVSTVDFTPWRGKVDFISGGFPCQAFSYAGKGEGQKRERLILIAVRNDYANQVTFEWPSPYRRVMTLRDAFFAGELYDTDVPASPCQTYPEKKQRIMGKVPEGGDWRNLPEEIQKEYMGASFYLGGGKTGMARRLAMDEPSLTLTCAPAQKQTERCHPIETRPLSVREYARIQTFPDNWDFAGAVGAQYKQIGNAVPVNLAWAVVCEKLKIL